MNKAQEFAHDIIEIFEEFLDEKGIVISNQEKMDNPDASNIYGEDYYSLEDRIAKKITKYCKGGKNE